MPRLEALTSVFWDAEHKSHRNNIFDQRRSILGLEFHRVLSRLGAKPGETFFEIGCGDSIFLEHLESKFAVVPYGVDFSPVGIELAMRRMPKWKDNFVLAHFAEAADVGRQYDFVGSFGFAEHMEDRREFWQTQWRITKDGGVCICIIPNLFGINILFGKAFADVLSCHVPVTINQLVAEADNVGFTLIESGYLGGYRLFATPKNKVFRLLKMALNGMLYMLWVIAKTNNYYLSPYSYVILKKDEVK